MSYAGYKHFDGTGAQSCTGISIGLAYKPAWTLTIELSSGNQKSKTKSPTLQLGFQENWCRLQDLNPPPHDYKSCALPDELSRQNWRPHYTLFDAGQCGAWAFFGRLRRLIKFCISVRVFPGIRHCRQPLHLVGRNPRRIFNARVHRAIRF